MALIWVLLTSIAIVLIYGGTKLQSIGYNQIGSVLVLIGIFQLIGETIALI